MSTSYKNRVNRNILSSSSTKENKEFLYGKVTKVFTGTGDPLSEGAIEYASFSKQGFPDVAYPLNYNFQQLPLLGEVVPLYFHTTLQKLYYGHSINVHNYPTHNSTDKIVVTTPNYEEPSTINPYTIFTGDTLLQGRFGQSLRFTQTIPNTSSQWSAGSKQGSSVVILSSGQVQTEDGSTLLQENLNEDAAILVLQEDGKLSYQGNDDYEGNQAYLASNRITLKAREDVISLSSQSGSFVLAPTTLSIDVPDFQTTADTFTTTNQTRTVESDTSTYNYNQFDVTGTNVNLNYNRIALGENAAEPIIQSTQFLADLAALNAQLVALSTALTGVTAVLAVLPGGQAPAAVLQTASTTLITQANTIQTKIASGNYLSSTVFSK